MENPDKVFIAVVDLNRPNTINHISISSEVFYNIFDVEEWLSENMGYPRHYMQWWILQEHNPNLKLNFIEYND